MNDDVKLFLDSPIFSSAYGSRLSWWCFSTVIGGIKETL